MRKLCLPRGVELTTILVKDSSSIFSSHLHASPLAFAIQDMEDYLLQRDKWHESGLFNTREADSTYTSSSIPSPAGYSY